MRGRDVNGDEEWQVAGSSSYFRYWNTKKKYSETG